MEQEQPNAHVDGEAPVVAQMDDFWDLVGGEEGESPAKRSNRRSKRKEASSGLMKYSKDSTETRKVLSSSGRNSHHIRGAGKKNVVEDDVLNLFEEKHPPPAPSLDDQSLFHDDEIQEYLHPVAPPRLQRSSLQRRGFGQQPGAMHVEGRGRRVPEENTESSTSSRRNEESTDDNLLVQAQLVPERLSFKVLVTATPDPWWRRHQWWLAGATAIAIVGVALTVVLTTVQLGGSNMLDQTTMSPTSVAEAIEQEISELILSALPSSAGVITDDLTPQYQALQWVMQQIIDEGSGFTETQVLQQYSLAALFFSTTGGGATWRQSNGWLNSATPCDWFGVECARDESIPEDIIVGLNLTDNGLSGMLIPDVSILGRNMRVLDLSHNDLSGSLSEDLGRMELLTQLSLGDNSLSGSIPSSFSTMSSLKLLDLSSNNLESTIPPELGVLGALGELRLEDNDISGEVPAALGLLSHLVHLDLSMNRLSFPLPTELGQLLRLETLSAHSNSLLGPLPTELGTLSSLETLTLSKNFIFNSIPFEMGDIANLKSLDVSHNLFTGSIPLSIAYLSQLSTLRAQGNFLDALPNEMQHLDSLEVLDLSSNFVEGSIPKRVWSLPNLRYLNVSDNKLSGDIEWGSPTLQMLDLSQNRFGPGLDFTIGLASSLTRLDLSENAIESTIPTELGSLRRLISIDFSYNLLNGSVPSELWSLPELRSLNVAGNLIQGTGIFPGALSLSNLIDLRLTNIILSASFPSQIGLLTSLESLWLDNTQLSGLLPSEVGLLTALTDFRVSDNLISGSIPSEVGRMSKLMRFEAGSNFLISTLPSEIALPSRLEYLDVSQNQLAGVIPTEIGLLSRLALFGLDSNGFSGMVPSELGSLTVLRELMLGSNSLSGVMPTSLGLLTELSFLELGRNLLTGGLPSEVGLATNLVALIVDSNRDLRGTIPSELGLLRNLAALFLVDNQLVGSLPSEIGLLSRLGYFLAFDNLITGSLPSEMGQLKFLSRLDLGDTLVSGPIPPELEMVSSLVQINIVGTAITGSIAEGICRRDDDSYDAGDVFFLVTVDCHNVACDCCNCPTPIPSVSPSTTFLPSRAPSTSNVPSDSHEPTLVPSLTHAPSVSLFPSRVESLCSNFVSISSFGQPLEISGLRDVVEVVNLPFSFKWRGQVDVTEVTVATNGVVFPGVNIYDAGCCDAQPFEVLGNRNPRIAVAQTALASSGSIYIAHEERAFIISWEQVFAKDEAPQNALDFQALLYENGNIELRWGEGNPVAQYFAAGVEDDSADVIVPATGPPFFDAASLAGVSRKWPRNQCRLFTVSTEGYDEVTF